MTSKTEQAANRRRNRFEGLRHIHFEIRTTYYAWVNYEDLKRKDPRRGWMRGDEKTEAVHAALLDSVCLHTRNLVDLLAMGEKDPECTDCPKHCKGQNPKNRILATEYGFKTPDPHPEQTRELMGLLCAHAAHLSKDRIKKRWPRWTFDQHFAPTLTRARDFLTHLLSDPEGLFADVQEGHPGKEDFRRLRDTLSARLDKPGSGGSRILVDPSPGDIKGHT